VKIKRFKPFIITPAENGIIVSFDYNTIAHRVDLFKRGKNAFMFTHMIDFQNWLKETILEDEND
jgi:hypothetical protein